MADYWKKKLEELNQTTQAKQKEDYWESQLTELEKEEEKKKTNNTTVKTTEKETDDRKWFEKGAFSDGYQFGDIFKTISGTSKDVATSAISGILGIGEKAIDAGAYAVGAVGGLFSDDFKESTKEFISKDIVDERAVAEKLLKVTNPLNALLADEEDSLLGDKSDSVVESGGQLIGTAALQAVGVPWFLTTGATSFGGEVENAFNQDATYGEAGLSAAITAGAEILTEKISGGIKFGGSTLDDALTKKLALGVSNKVLRTMTKLGMDVVGEGSEEVISQVFSNLGTSLYRDESLSEILFSEEALDEYLESFIGGAALGGAGSVVNAGNAAANGVDATSGMTENEEKVFKKVYEDRIAEAEKDGEKLTAKEKSKIYEEVENDLEKGYISTDTIEEVLGGETYAEYKNTTESENALREEFETLGAMKKSDFTAKQDDRYNELKQKLAEIESGDARNQLKTKLSGEVFALTEGSRLAESYNERGRRGEKFDADLTAYDEKQKAVVQKAIDSGILNNTNRTHEFVDMVAKISADKGVLFDFTNNTKLKDSGFAVDGKTVNGFVNQDGVTVNIDSAKSLNSVVGHEITHVLEGTELYAELQSAVVEYAKTKGDYQGRYDSLSELYKGIEGADIDAELTADLVGDYLFTDADFVNNLSVTNRNVFQKIYDEVKYLVKVATAGSKEARELAKVKRAFDKAYQSGGAVADTKFSIDKYTEKQYNTFGWARYAEGITKNELDDMYSKIQEKGSLKKFMQTSKGEAIVEVNDDPYNLGTDNVFAFVVGTKNNPQVNRVVRFQAETETEMEIIKEKLYERGSFSNTYYSYLKQYGIAREYSKASSLDYNGYKERTRGRSFGEDGNAVDGNRGSEQNRSGAVAETQSNEVTPDKASSNGGVFFDGKNQKYSLSEDTEGRELSNAVKTRFGNSKVVDENGSLKVVYHGTATGEFSIFDKSKGSVEGDFGSGFYFTDNEADVSEHYEGGGPDFDNKVGRRADEIWNDEPDIEYEEAERRAREELFKGSHKFEVYLNIENPAVVGETMLFTDESYLEQYNEEDYDDYDDYIADVEQLLADDIENIVWEVERNVDLNSTDGIADVLFNAYYEGGIGIEELKAKLNDLYLEDSNGNLVANEVARQIIESLGYDGIVDPTVSGKWNMDIEEGTTHYIVFKPNQIKAVTNENPTDNPDIHRSLSRDGETAKEHGRYHIKGEDVALDVAPVQDSVQDDVQDDVQDIAPVPEESVKPNERRLAWYNRWGDKVADVPVMEDIAPSEPSLPQLRRELESVAAKAQEAMNAGDAEALNALGQRYEELNQQIRSMEADEDARVSSLEDADAPPEVDAPYYGESEAVMPDDPFENRDQKKVKDEKSYMYENPEVKPFFQAEANILLGELDRTDKAQTYYNGWIKQDMSYEFAQDIPEVYRTSRVTSPSIAALRDEYGMSYDDIRKGLNALIEDHGAENIAAAKRIEFEINDRLMKGYQDDMGNDIPANAEYLNLLNEKQISAYSDEARRSFFESVGATNIAPVRAMDDIAPTYYDTSRKGEIEGQQTMNVMRRGEPFVSKIKGADEIAPTYDTRKRGEAEGQQTMLDEGGNDDGKIAKVMVGEPDVEQKKVSGWQKFRTNILDKFSVFEDLALKRKNRELMGKANYMLSSEARAQNMIGQGDDGVKSLNAIREEVEKTGQTERFYNYMYHRHNVDRMSLEEKARPVVEGLYQKFGHLRKDQLYAIAAKEITEKTTEKTAQSIRDAREYLKAIDAKNKPVFGDSVTADVSRERVSFYERTNPEFKRMADDVYTYVNHLRGLMVENGVISQETADLWAEMYPHYVPIRRLGKSGLAVNVPLDTNKTGINAPIKRAEGGNSDIMDMFDTIALRTEQTYRAIAKNSFGVELKNTLGTTLQKSTASLDEVIDSVDTHEELLKKGENGANPTFTVFENGERVEFEITEAMYDALKPVSDGLRYVNPVANKISNFHRGVLTEYNPVFSMTNAIKDAQDILINSQHPVKTYVNMPTAIKQMAKNGAWYREYIKNGGEQNTYFDGKTNTFTEEDKMWKKVAGLPLRGISWWNNKIETLPRLAEYIASRKKGASVEVAMLDAARVTTNFQAGGDVTKFIDRNGATFLNASIQGFNQQVRNVREAKANGAKGWLQLAAKTAIAGLPVLFLNEALWGDDEEYEELSDYVKDSYYIVAKFDDGKFLRIPKGRAMAVIQDAFEQVKNALTGDDEVDLRNFLDLAFTNLAPNNPWDNNIIAPVRQAVKNKAWYGGDIVPTRLQDMPSAEQYDESTDSFSKWLGEKTNTSPMKWNYVLNQYGGGVSDVVLPYFTPEAESGGNKLLAPLTSKFTADSVMNNQNVTDFYDKVDELTKNANSAKATDEDILKSKYMNSINSELSALYQQKREIQNSTLSDAKKNAAVREVQKQIDAMTAEGLNTYGNVKIDGVYATVGVQISRKIGALDLKNQIKSSF